MHEKFCHKHTKFTPNCKSCVREDKYATREEQKKKGEGKYVWVPKHPNVTQQCVSDLEAMGLDVGDLGGPTEEKSDCAQASDKPAAAPSTSTTTSVATSTTNSIPVQTQQGSAKNALAASDGSNARPTTPAPVPAASDEESPEAEEKRRKKEYVARRERHLASRGDQEGTQFMFYDTAPISMFGLWAWPVFTTLWLYMLPVGTPEVASVSWAIMILRTVGVPFYGCQYILRVLMESFLGDENMSMLGTALFFGLVNAIWLGEIYCSKKKLPFWRCLFLRIVLQYSAAKATRVVHSYTLVWRGESDSVDTRPKCNGRATLDYMDADYATWQYQRQIGNRVVKTKLVRCSLEALTQVCSNPRIMHLRTTDELVKEQIKSVVGTMECVNIDRNYVLEGASLSAGLEAVCYAFYKHHQRTTKDLPF